MVKIIGVGLACMDFLLQVPDMQQIQRGGELQGFKTQGGGMAATAMVTVTRLGGQAELWTALGQDPFAPQIVAGLEAEGVDMSQTIHLAEQGSHVAFVLIDAQNGNRTFWGTGGARKTRFLDYPTMPDLTRLDQADVVHVDGLCHQVAIQALRYARERNIPTCGDIEYLDGNELLLPLIDYLIVPEEMAIEVTGTADEAALPVLAQHGAKMVVITLGERGACYWQEGEVGHIPAFPVETVDTTGAGDVFHGAFVFGLAQGWETRRLLTFASAVAAMKCTQLGGRTGIPDLASVEAFLMEREQNS